METPRIYLKNMAKALWGLMKKAVPNLQKSASKDSTKLHAGYYQTLDEMPLWNWIKVTDGDHRYVRKSIAVGSPKLDQLFFDQIYDEYIRDFGLSELHKKMLQAIRKRTLLELDYVITRNQFLVTEIEIQIARLEGMMKNNGSGMTIEQTVIHISKWMNTWINIKTISVRDYFNLMNEMKRTNQTTKQTGKTRKNNG